MPPESAFTYGLINTCLFLALSHRFELWRARQLCPPLAGNLVILEEKTAPQLPQSPNMTFFVTSAGSSGTTSRRASPSGLRPRA